jgi:hypothetical protein
MPGGPPVELVACDRGLVLVVAVVFCWVQTATEGQYVWGPWSRPSVSQN